MKKQAEYIWYNDNFVKWQEANIHVLTYGMHYAIAAFEGIRIYNGIPFKADEHYQRLRKSAKVCGMDISYSEDYLVNATLDLISKNNLQNGYIRPIVWLNGQNLLLSSKDTYTEIAIAAWPSFYKTGSKDSRQRPLRLMVSGWKKASADAFPNAHKTTASYMVHYMIKQEAVATGFDDALILDMDENIAEASTSNFFIIKDNKLVTPSKGDFLLGITRNTVVELAKINGIEVLEKKISLADLEAIEPDAAFLTGTAIELRAIESININGKEIVFDIENALFSKILSFFHAYVLQQ